MKYIVRQSKSLGDQICGLCVGLLEANFNLLAGCTKEHIRS
jgi:hypothetical protein